MLRARAATCDAGGRLSRHRVLRELRVSRCVDSYGLLQMEVAMKAPNHSLIASDRIEGTLVRRPNGEKIGKIKRLMIDKASGRIAYAVMSFGGLFGLGDNYYQIPWSLLKYNQSFDAYESDIPDEQLAKTFWPQPLETIDSH
jgi:sporulation protein YlmC with PRC-barrel domain